MRSAVVTGAAIALEHDVRSLASWQRLLGSAGEVHVPEEVAAAVAYLASDAAGFVTGATLDVNGGMLMR